jgi:hypothetical protein
MTRRNEMTERAEMVTAFAFQWFFRARRRIATYIIIIIVSMARGFSYMHGLSSVSILSLLLVLSHLVHSLIPLSDVTPTPSVTSRGTQRIACAVPPAPLSAQPRCPAADPLPTAYPTRQSAPVPSPHDVAPHPTKFPRHAADCSPVASLAGK